jgi:hypothetical protein
MVYLYTMGRILFVGLLFGLVFSFTACDSDDAKPDPVNLPVYNVQVQIKHIFGGQSLALNEEIYETANGDTVSFTRLVYHLNKFKFFSDSGIVERPDLYFLVDAEDENTLTLAFDSLDDMAFDSVQFTVGVADSVDNADGLLNSMFTDPMYWGMINGYINMKLEGRSSSVVSDSVYILHIGGYMGDYKLSSTVSLDFAGSKLQNKLGKNILSLDVDLSEYFQNPNSFDIGINNRIHSPNDSAKMISENWPSMFEFGGVN